MKFLFAFLVRLLGYKVRYAYYLQSWSGRKKIDRLNLPPAFTWRGAIYKKYRNIEGYDLLKNTVYFGCPLYKTRKKAEEVLRKNNGEDQE